MAGPSAAPVAVRHPWWVVSCSDGQVEASGPCANARVSHRRRELRHSRRKRFYHEVGRVFLAEPTWTGNLAVLNDLLRWPCFEAGRPYLLVWKNLALSKQRLGHEQMTRTLGTMLQTCHPSNTQDFTERLDQTRQGRGVDAVRLAG